MGDDTDLLPTALEIASCAAQSTVDLDAPPSRYRLDPLVALEAAILPALQRPPCVVSFSGGMDSSFVLFVAARLARTAGLPAPIPVTWRFTGAPRADESTWQDTVLSAIPGLDWQLLHAADDLDLIGPVAQRVLTRHGVLLPPNVHLHLPIVELARGGSLLTGVGGDQMLIGRSHPGLLRRLRGRVPAGLVTTVRRRQGRDPFPWLRRPASRAVVREQRRDTRREPHAFDRRTSWRARRRDLLLACASLDRIASTSDTRVVNPLLDAGFVAALGATFAREPAMRRADLLRRIAGTALPAAATDARPKAHFLEVFLRAPTRDFVHAWDGRGADDNIVDAEVLRHLWSQWPIPEATASLVQQLWLSSTDADTNPTKGS